MDQDEKIINMKVENAALRALVAALINELGKNDPNLKKGVKETLQDSLDKEGHDPLYAKIIESIIDSLS